MLLVAFWWSCTEMGRMELVLGGPNGSPLSGGRRWRKEAGGQCDVGHKGGILGGLGGRRVG